MIKHFSTYYTSVNGTGCMAFAFGRFICFDSELKGMAAQDLLLFFALR
jgi:hypothetical protein